MTTQEEILFRIKKTKSVILYQNELKKAEEVIAGSGFSSAPGHLYMAQLNLELFLKMDLTEASFLILQETIQQEIKQAGVDYDQALKNAMIAWELEKQELMTNWDREIKSIEQGLDNTEEDLKRLQVEISRRGIVLVQAKAALSLALEEYRTQIAELDGTVSPFEVQLAQAKVLTANKKLEIIPYIEAIIAIEQSIILKEAEILGINEKILVQHGLKIAIEEQVVAKNEEIVGKDFLIIGKDQLLLGKGNEMLVKDNLLLTRKEEAVVLDTVIAGLEEEIVTTEQDILDGKTSNLSIKVEITDKELEVLAVDAQIILADKSNYTIEHRLIAQKFRIISAGTDIVGKINGLILQEYSILTQEESIVASNRLILDKDGEVLTQKELVLLADQEVLVADTSIVASKTLVIEQDALVIDKDGEVVAKETEGLSVDANIVSEDENILALQPSLTQKDDELITKGEDLNDAERLVYDEENSSLLVAVDALIEAEQAAVDYRISALQPAITSLTTALGNYTVEIGIQTELRNDIAVINAQIAVLKSDEILKIDNILAKKELLAQKNQELITKTNLLIEYQVDNLAPAIASLANKYNEYQSEIAVQVALESQILTVKNQIIALGDEEIERRLGLARKSTELEGLHKELVEAQNTARTAALILRNTIIQLEADIVQSKSDAAILAQEQINLTDETGSRTVDSLILEVAGIDLDKRLDSKIRLEDEQRFSLIALALRDAQFTEDDSLEKLTPNITSTLTHLLSQ
jgi:hypothetical protein